MKWRSFLVVFTLMGGAFYGGYIAGNEGLFAPNIEHLKQAPPARDPTSRTPPETVKHAWQNLEQALQKSDQKQLFVTNDAIDESADKRSLSVEQISTAAEIFRWQDPNDIVAMFDELISLSELSDNQDLGAFSRAIDQLRGALTDSPTQLAILVEHLQSLNFDSKEFHYITAILQGLPDQKGYAALQNTALRLSQRDDAQSRQQFLQLVSNTYNSADNPEILSALVDIALYSDSPANTKLEALDLLMPFQITSIEKGQILTHINTMLESADSAEQGALVNHALRFSDSQERQRMAEKFIDKENNIELRYSILDGLRGGTVPRSAQIKEALFTIASDRSDPLHQQAKHALMYTFDISNQEYQLLKQ